MTETTDIETQFRKAMFGDLPILKFILDASPKGRRTPSGDIATGEWGKILFRWVRRYEKQLTPKEHVKLQKELVVLEQRLIIVHSLHLESGRLKQCLT